eukprot:1313752-Pyramimonas_sp.AAC.1
MILAADWAGAKVWTHELPMSLRSLASMGRVKPKSTSLHVWSWAFCWFVVVRRGEGEAGGVGGDCSAAM